MNCRDCKFFAREPRAPWYSGWCQIELPPALQGINYKEDRDTKTTEDGYCDLGKAQEK